MPNRKEVVKFYISLEGDTEEWYFKHLQSLVNVNQNSTFNLKLETKLNKSPKKFIKNIPIAEANCFHIFDYESKSYEHNVLFKKILKEVKEINDTYQDKVLYKAGYSNLSFDLWILLHKMKFSSVVSHCRQYLQLINQAYGANFESMDKYKQKENFKKLILPKISLKDIFNAIKYAKEIKTANEQNLKKSKEIYGFKYFIDNPDLSIHECIETIFNECGVSIN